MSAPYNEKNDLRLLNVYFRRPSNKGKKPKDYATETSRGRNVLGMVARISASNFEKCIQKHVDPKCDQASFKAEDKRNRQEQDAAFLYSQVTRLTLEASRYLEFDPQNIKNPKTDMPITLLHIIANFSPKEYRTFLKEYFTEEELLSAPRQAEYKIALDKITKGFAVVPKPVQARAPNQSGVGVK